MDFSGVEMTDNLLADAAKIIAPIAGRCMRNFVAKRERKGGKLRFDVDRVDLFIIACASHTENIPVEGNREHKTAVVIGVLTDQVESTWRAEKCGRSRAKMVNERLSGLLVAFPLTVEDQIIIAINGT